MLELGVKRTGQQDECIKVRGGGIKNVESTKSIDIENRLAF